MPDATPQTRVNRAIHLLLVAVIGIAFVGFFVGIRQGTTVPDLQPPPRPAPRTDVDAIPATAYGDFDRRLYGPNRDWHSSLTQLQQPETPLTGDPGRDEALRAQLVSARAERRAFEGAPPTVPHPIDQMSTASCMACHGDGLYVGKGMWAPQMSHPYYPSCTQCHAEMHSPELEGLLLAENLFEGYSEIGPGGRAWEGAPATIPHPVFMRENCMSCHGPHGPNAIRTTHPWRANCLQCHAPTSPLDQPRG